MTFPQTVRGIIGESAGRDVGVWAEMRLGRQGEGVQAGMRECVWVCVLEGSVQGGGSLLTDECAECGIERAVPVGVPPVLPFCPGGGPTRLQQQVWGPRTGQTHMRQDQGACLPLSRAIWISVELGTLVVRGSW